MTDSIDLPKNEQEAAPPELTLSDLSAIKSVMEVATQRGAFKAQELTAVGQIYDKLSLFLNSINKQSQKSTFSKGV